MSDFGIIGERIGKNLGDIGDAERRLETVKNAQMYELALSYAQSDASELCRAYEALSDSGFACREFAALCKYRSAILGVDNARRETERIVTADGNESDAEKELQDSVACMENNMYSDAALRRFFRGSLADRIYVQSFSEACEKVSYGVCKYCILPVSSTSDGAFTSFKKLMRRFDLRISAVCDVPLADGESVTRFALLSRELELSYSGNGYFEFTSPIIMKEELIGILSGLAELGAETVSITTEQMPYSDSEALLGAVLDISKCDLYALILFMKYALPRHERLGIYKKV